MHTYKDRVSYVVVIAGDILESKCMPYNKEARLRRRIGYYLVLWFVHVQHEFLFIN